MHRKKSRLIISVLAIIIFAGYSFSTQNDAIFNKIIGRLASYVAKNSPEKIYVHTDKDIYTNGETIWFKAYLVDGIFHKNSNKSEILYVELLDGDDTIVARRKMRVTNSVIHGEIALPNNISEGKYLLRSYTKYMLNDRSPVYFQKEVPIFHQKIDEFNTKVGQLDGKDSLLNDSSTLISDTASGVEVQLFPEGGDLVVGQTSILGIKISNIGEPDIDKTGSIINSKNEPLAFFKIHETGLGTVAFTPESNEEYYARITLNGQEKKFPVPPAQQTGYVLSVRNNADHLVLNVSTNKLGGLEGCLVVGHFRGDIFYKHIGTPENANAYSVKLKTDRLPDGVAHFTLFTEQGEPVCERLVFIDHPDNDIHLSVKSDLAIYGQRDKVSVEIDAFDKDSVSFKGNFSMSVVTKSNRLPLNIVRTDIKSWLLLDSDLGGSVEDAGYFFENDSRERKILLDALMLTHGWRRFVWKELLDDVNSSQRSYSPEKAEGIILSGYTALEKDSRVAKKATVLLKIPKQGINKAQVTDKQGRFSFGPFDLSNGEKTYLEISQYSNKGKRPKNDLAIYLDKEWPEVPVKRKNESRLLQVKKGGITNDDRVTNKVSVDTVIKTYLRQSYVKKVSDFKFDSTITQLDEVTVSSKKKRNVNENITQSLQATSSVRVISDSVAPAGTLSAMDLIGRAAGVSVTGTYPDQKLVITVMSDRRSTAPILYLVNGNEVDVSQVQNMNSSEILYVDVLRGHEAAVYGSRASGGAVLITTKGRNSIRRNSPDQNKPEQFIPGFYKTREFFSPSYERPKEEYKKSDYRTTLHWQPDIVIENNNSGLIQFYTADTVGDFIIKVEGITKDGRAVVGYSEFSVQ